MKIMHLIAAVACIVFETSRFLLLQLPLLAVWWCPTLLYIFVALARVVVKNFVAMIITHCFTPYTEPQSAVEIPILNNDSSATTGEQHNLVCSPLAAPPNRQLTAPTDRILPVTKTNDQPFVGPFNTTQLQPVRSDKLYCCLPADTGSTATVAVASTWYKASNEFYSSETAPKTSGLAVVAIFDKNVPILQPETPYVTHSTATSGKHSRQCLDGSTEEDSSPLPRKVQRRHEGRGGVPVHHDAVPEPYAAISLLRTSRVGKTKSHSNISGRTSYQSDLIVVLDLDECLVHAKLFDEPFKASFYAHQVHNTSTKPKSVTAVTTAVSVGSLRVRLDHISSAYVKLRPGVMDFLKEITSMYETHIYTAATRGYADPVLNYLCSRLGHSAADDDDDDLFAGRWYRQDCAYDAARNAYVKDLTRLPVLLDRTVLVDNNPLSFLAQPQNGILVNSFFDDSADRTLGAVARFIATKLVPTADVRSVLANGPYPIAAFAPNKSAFSQE